MAEYKKGNETKNRIIDASRRLFFEKGYVNTYYEDICKAAEVNPGQIHYYFKTKKSLAAIVFNDFMFNIKGLVDSLLMDKYDLQIKTAVELRNYMRLVMSDKNCQRFLTEIQAEKIADTSSIEMSKYFFELHVKEYNLDITDKELKTIAVLSCGLDADILAYYFNGYIEQTAEELTDYYIEFTFRFLRIDYSRVREIIEISREVAKKIHCELSDSFELSMRWIESE